MAILMALPANLGADSLAADGPAPAPQVGVTPATLPPSTGRSSTTPSGNAPLAALEIRVVEGDEETYALGSRATRGVTIRVSDENGRPVNGATVSFTLPSSGPSGVFASGAKTEATMTQADGTVAVWGMQWNRTAGRFEMRVTASKGQARAGTVVAGYLSETPGGKSANADQSLPRHSAAGNSGSGGHKWLWIGLAIGGAAAAAGGILAAKGFSGSAASANVTIGNPSVTLGHN
jgi:hypothetical protein